MMNNNNQHNQDNQDNQHTDGNTNRDTNAMDSSRYASLLYSSRNAQRMITPKYLCNLSFILILGLKLTDGTTVPWPYVFVALFLSNNSSFYVKFQEFAYFLTNGEYMVGLGRQLASFVDLIGSFVAKIALCSYLSTFDSNLNTFNGNDSSGGNSGDDYSGDAGDGSDAGNSINSHNNSTSSASNNRVSSSLTFLLLPLWISLLVSVFIRYCCKNFPIDSTDSNRFSISSMESYGTTLVFVVTRGLQPLLISLKVDKVLDINWFFVLGPLYSLAFIGLSIAILMVSFAPFIHITSSSQLRHQALGLVHVVALQIAIVSLCVIVFLVLLCKRIELSHNLDSSTSNNVDQRSPFDILSPLLIMFTLLIITNPLLMAYSQRYQYYLSATVLQRLDRPSGNSTNDAGSVSSGAQTVSVAFKNQINWLIQRSINLYVICDIPKAVEDFLKTESDSGRELLDIAQKDNSANSFNCTAENHAAIEESTENVRDTSRWYPHNYRDRNVMDSSVLRFDSPRIRSESDIGLFVNRSDSQSMPSNQTSNSMGRYINNIVTSDVVGRHNRIPVIHGIEASNGIDYNAGRQNASTITTVANSMMDRLRRHANRYALLSNDHDDRSDLNPTNATINRDIERGQHMQIELSSRPSNLIQPSTGENIMTLSPVDESHYGGEEVTSPLLEISTSGVLSLDTAHDSNSENPSFMDHGEHIIFRHRQLLQKITKFIEQLPVRDAKIPSEACDQGSDQRISGLVNNDSSKCNQCIVCFDTEIDTAIMPCGHSVMCLGCCLILAEHSSGGHCPVCRTSMKAIFQFATKPFAVPIDRNLNDVTTNSTGSHGSENNIGENVVVTVSNRCYRIERVTRPVYRGSINPGFRGDREPGDRPILRNQEIFHHFNSSGMANVDAFPNTVSTYAIDSNVAMNNIVLDLFS